MNTQLYQAAEAHQYVRTCFSEYSSDEDFGTILYLVLRETYGIHDHLQEQRLTAMNFTKSIMIQEVARDQYIQTLVYSTVNLPPNLTSVIVMYKNMTLWLYPEPRINGTDYVLS